MHSHWELAYLIEFALTFYEELQQFIFLLRRDSPGSSSTLFSSFTFSAASSLSVLSDGDFSLETSLCFTYIQIRFSAALEDKTVVSYTSAKTGCKCLNNPGSSSRKSSTSFLWQKLWPLPVSAVFILLSVYQSSYPILCNNQHDQFYPYFFCLSLWMIEVLKIYKFSSVYGNKLHCWMIFWSHFFCALGKAIVWITKNLCKKVSFSFCPSSRIFTLFWHFSHAVLVCSIFIWFLLSLFSNLFCLCNSSHWSTSLNSKLISSSMAQWSYFLFLE